MFHILKVYMILLFTGYSLSFKAARLTSAARKLKQNSLQIRVFGYPSSSQLDLDSFVLFTHSAEMKVT